MVAIMFLGIRYYAQVRQCVVARSFVCRVVCVMALAVSRAASMRRPNRFAHLPLWCTIHHVDRHVVSSVHVKTVALS